MADSNISELTDCTLTALGNCHPITFGIALFLVLMIATVCLGFVTMMMSYVFYAWKGPCKKCAEDKP